MRARGREVVATGTCAQPLRDVVPELQIGRVSDNQCWCGIRDGQPQACRGIRRIKHDDDPARLENG